MTLDHDMLGADLTSERQRHHALNPRPVQRPTVAEQIAECRARIAYFENLQMKGALCPAFAGMLTGWRKRLGELSAQACRVAAE